jgi:hypothetical protein
MTAEVNTFNIMFDISPLLHHPSMLSPIPRKYQKRRRKNPINVA